MDIKLKLHIKTPAGIARKIKISNDGEILFVAPKRVMDRISMGRRIYVDTEEEFSLDACEIWVVEED